jgi:hypothetical protein
VGRQKLLRQQRKNRDAREIIADLKKQRDSAANLLVDANHRIVELTYELNAARARLDAARSSAPVIDLPKRK